ncbi:MAG: 2-C-methyl-D-erythritol 4-phosphate cytidylyltransferase [Candidatus Brocadia sp.]|jgi:2-C-methyl-D-erythritol 4-phosphate cytidylyltransferase|uniref:2-C-methyl-D-erythritol 4-phosphate cytidylyltransferase n=1 Tax=Candidatus Brocadia fulgida TaxID=380242 RepID=A0A0M2UTY1_9BACT|nr:MAG: 2-C-methyl-D-erythritol 4-phosphate cytidylyltransferase [Candidatus Brocadia fulgida]MCE7910691.1 2-C-methyl-D-erythritol 4-phosphate cytidylyltransferase [Candidatus Brocadia sp. AMX3]MDG5996019.1 2-C-methyl-D-erythritol 4-phosphate cytidylyltransferase [Candidatus Brocadia sp.]OQY97966.1 MAG: 2-C-methyl-D-erythritol 4-phosphate cytidylyltransferase [Candidatus Brocadia sp. UTAMX2]MBV6518845.1 2-C-methyl-D-erythritol 4-phosphate cytidylyltransferase [Candidatus Brocadia fulgida]
MNVSVVLVGAGLGLRMGGSVKKPFLQIRGKPIFLYTIERFSQIETVGEIILVVGQTEIPSLRDQWQNTLIAHKVKKIVPGGKRRQDSVYNGLCQTETDAEVVLIHDIVRPLVRKEHIETVISKAKESHAAILAAPMKATVKEASGNLCIRQTIPRNNLWMAQTPQGFNRELILKVFGQFKTEEREFTDDAEMVEKAGYRVEIVPGTDDNIKITTPEDIRIAEALLTNG